MQLRKRSAGSRHDYGSTRLRPAALRPAALRPAALRPAALRAAALRAAALRAAALRAAALWAAALWAAALWAAAVRAAVPVIGAGYRWRIPSYSCSPPQRRPGQPRGAALSLQLYRSTRVCRPARIAEQASALVWFLDVHALVPSRAEAKSIDRLSASPIAAA